MYSIPVCTIQLVTNIIYLHAYGSIKNFVPTAVHIATSLFCAVCSEIPSAL